MRFLRLELAAFGAFDGRVLEFGRDGRGFHLIYGDNEAGKTTALRAIPQLLFGIDAQTTLAFRFEYNELRLGAAIVDERGETLEFVRRKGNKRTLRTPGGDELPEGALKRFLGGFDEAAFRTKKESEVMADRKTELEPVF